MKKNIFIGLAWPYANGSLHLGHVASLLGGDILARYHRLNGDNVLFASGSDCYGTPIAVEADNLGITPQELSEKYHKEFTGTLINGLGFTYDIYTKTSTENHTKVVQELFLDLYKKGHLYTKVSDALFSPKLNRFLPDRYVEGICPKCDFESARGDQCDNCGSLLDPLELKNPKINKKILKDSIGDVDVELEVRQSEHFYFKLENFQKMLEEWVENTSDIWRVNASSFTKAFLKKGLHERAITRDTDWGVPIPIDGYEDKKIYVWFEAVSGYLSASKEWAKVSGDNDAWKKWWCDDNSFHYYVHGKDNIPFHTLIWPSILMGEGSLNLPNSIISSEYLNLEGKQFSKSRNFAIWVNDFLEHFNSDTLRYFLVVNGPETSDSNFAWSEYGNQVNGELIGTYGNLVNRVFSFTKSHFKDGVKFPEVLDSDSNDLLDFANSAFKKVGSSIESGKFRSAFRQAMEVAEKGNKYIDIKEPWGKIKDESKKGEVEKDLAVLIHLIKCLSVLFEPFTPKVSQKTKKLLGIEGQSWEYPKPNSIKIDFDVKPLFKKIEDEDIETQLNKLN